MTYYNKFKYLWDELYGSDDVTCGCTCSAAAKIRARFETVKTHDFLLVLEDAKYGPIRTQSLGMNPFPIINKAFSMVTQEKRHQTIVRDRDDTTEALSFAVPNTLLPRLAAPSSSSYGSLLCTYCSKSGHDFDHCYQRLGYPSSRGRGQGRHCRGGVASTWRGQAVSSQGSTAAHAATSTAPSPPNTSSNVPPAPSSLYCRPNSKIVNTYRTFNFL